MNFDKFYCVNLEADTDRKEIISKKFDEINILDKISWVSATPPQQNFQSTSYRRNAGKGAFGCALSHLKIMVDALSSNTTNGIMIFEDDIVIDDISKLNDIMNNDLPKDWDVLYIGGKPAGPVTRYSENLINVDNRYHGTFGYAVSSKAIKGLADFFIDNFGKTFSPNNCLACADNILSRYAMKGNSYCVYPTLVKAEPGWSNIENQVVDYTEVTAAAWKKFLT